MIIYNLKNLIHKKAIKENRKLTYDIIACESGVSKSVLTRIAALHPKPLSSVSIEKLCLYFECGCSELMTIVPDEND